MSVHTETGTERDELEEVLTSEVFSKSPSLAKMLRYIGLKYLEGQQDSIKEYNIGVEALGRPPYFDPKRDSIVRVEAVRLRQKLKRYYETEGADHAVIISLKVGHYIPQFIRRSEEQISSTSPSPSHVPFRRSETNGRSQLEMLDRKGEAATPDFGGILAKRHLGSYLKKWKWWFGLALIVAAAGITLVIKRAMKPTAGQRLTAKEGLFRPNAKAPPMIAGDSTGSAVRIIAGYSSKEYVDSVGEVWGPDRYYTGGRTIVEPDVFIARAPNPIFFDTAREGKFSYNIPLKPGTYELQLYFVENEFGPRTPRGGGETSRVFSINLNGKPLLTDFDIYSDAGGTNIADERVFKDVSPAPDGILHLTFVKEINYPILNALGIFPSPSGKIRPIRIVAQNHSYTNSAGHVWEPDRYFMDGRQVISNDLVQDTPDPGLYSDERYGNFSYAIPVAQGRYAVTLYFAETHFGPDDVGGGGAGSRVFDVNCNGLALLRNFDIFKEAGGDNRALIRTFHNLRPNAQGKLLLSFIPVKNYASVRAIKVVEEFR